jgi:hypothetical protein
MPDTSCRTVFEEFCVCWRHSVVCRQKNGFRELGEVGARSLNVY